MQSEISHGPRTVPMDELADKMSRAKFSRNDRVIPKRQKMHPALKQAHDAHVRAHGMKFAMNAGRGFKKKA